MFGKFLLGAGLLAGTIIGAGVFVLPFVFAQAGVLTCLAYLIFFTWLVFAVHAMYADVVARTEGDHRLVGFSGLYLGIWGRRIALVINFIGLLLALVAYLILGGRFAHLIWPLPIGSLVFLFWALGTLMIFWKIRRLALGELLATISMILLIVLLVSSSFARNDLSLLFDFSRFGLPLVSLPNIFLPYGAILFALWGRTAIPPLVRMLKGKISADLLKKTILAGVFVSALVYLFFVFGVLNYSARLPITEDALSGLLTVLPAGLVWLIGLLGLLALFTSYAVIGRNIYQGLTLDVKANKLVAGLGVALIPMLIYLAGFRSLISLVGVVGGIFIAAEGILIPLIWLKASKRNAEQALIKHLPSVLPYFLMAVFIGGIVYQFIYSAS
ncbi:MAG TPA: aromatic amino acid transport family protein [Candidatus Tyrphobacter sp.]|nr:aromatic amino acid transport family protein [Candidatus Tyrphobacter sp.]